MIDNRKLLREVEEEIIDKEYLRYNLVNCPADISIMALFTFYHLLCIEINKRDEEEFRRATFLSQLSKGLSNCLKWIIGLSKEKNIDSENVYHLENLKHDVPAFLRWGENYNNIVIEFIMYSSGYSSCEIDLNNKTLFFEHNKHFKTGYKIFFELQLIRFLEDFLEKRREVLGNHTFDRKYLDNYEHPIELSKLCIDDVFLRKIIEFLEQNIIPDLENDYELEGFRLGEYRKVYGLLYYLSELVKRNDFVKHSLDNIIKCNKEKLLFFLSKQLSLSQESVRNIINTLKLDTRFYSTVLYKPLVCVDKDILFSPIIFRSLHPSPVLLTYLSKDAKSKYDTMSNTIESKKLNNIEEYLKIKLGCKILREPDIRYEGKKKTPDFIIRDNENKTILIIDFKNFNPLISPKDTLNKNKETESGIIQVKEYIEIISTKKIDVLENIQEYLFIGLLLFDVPVQINYSTEFDDDVFIMDLMCLKDIFKERNDLKYLRKRFMLRSKRIIDDNKQSTNKIEILVNDWKVVKPVNLL